MPNISFPSGYIPPSCAIYTPANPTAPNSTASFQMQGLGALITPATPAANIVVRIEASAISTATTVGNGIIMQIYYAPITSGGTAPGNNVAIPGAAVSVGNTLEWATGVTLTTAADSFIPIAIGGVARGLTPGQQYWFDIAAKAITTASQVQLTAVTVTLIEIG
jgi:hypothetical protein